MQPLTTLKPFGESETEIGSNKNPALDPQEAILRDPDNLDLYYEMIKRSDIPDSIKIYLNIISHFGPENLNLAKITYIHLLQIAPENVEVHLTYLSVLYKHKKDTDEILSTFRRLSDIYLKRNDSAKYLRSLSMIINSKKSTDLKKCYYETLFINGRKIEAANFLNGWASTRLQKEKWSKVLLMFHKPETPKEYELTLLEYKFSAAQLWPESKKRLKYGMDLSNDFDMNFKNGKKIGETEEAQLIYRQKYENERDIAYELSKIYVSQGNLLEAEKICNTVHKKFNDFRSLEMLGELLAPFDLKKSLHYYFLAVELAVQKEFNSKIDDYFQKIRMLDSDFSHLDSHEKSALLNYHYTYQTVLKLASTSKELEITTNELNRLKWELVKKEPK